MNNIEWGPEIAVNGVRPAWLADDDRLEFRGKAARWCYGGLPGEDWRQDPRQWSFITALRLPADHFAYTAIDAGFVPWGGGDSAPEDWDGDPRAIILRNGDVTGNYAGRWKHIGNEYDIIGYRKRAEPVAEAATEWGAEIPVNGKCPTWLSKSDIIDVRTASGWRYSKATESHPNPPEDWAWSHTTGEPCILGIRLPSDHFAYAAIGDGFEPWPGGDSAPKDWDGGEVLLKDCCPPHIIPGYGVTCWRRTGFADIIGYRKRTKPVAEPGPEWGAEIPVNGKRPAWLRDEVFSCACHPDSEKSGGESRLIWDSILAIRLRPDHFAYTAIKAGFEPWAGGASEPDDWDVGTPVLFESGQESIGWFDWHWTRKQPKGWAIIGYRKRAEPGPSDADIVTLKRFTETEAALHYPHLDRYTLRNLGLIREETAAERFTRETGYEVTPAVEAALAWERAA